MMAKNDKKNEYFGLGEAWVEVIEMATTLRDVYHGKLYMLEAEPMTDMRSFSLVSEMFDG
jgi:hypothetical protein